MSVEANIALADGFFIGEDKTIAFHVKDAAGVPVNIAGWALRWSLRTSLDATTEALAKTTAGGIAISGAYSADPTLNAQRAIVSVADTDTDSLAARTYVHALKRTDDGFEAVLSHGTVALQLAAAR